MDSNPHLGIQRMPIRCWPLRSDTRGREFSSQSVRLPQGGSNLVIVIATIRLVHAAAGQAPSQPSAVGSKPTLPVRRASLTQTLYSYCRHCRPDAFSQPRQACASLIAQCPVVLASSWVRVKPEVSRGVGIHPPRLAARFSQHRWNPSGIICSEQGVSIHFEGDQRVRVNLTGGLSRRNADLR